MCFCHFRISYMNFIHNIYNLFLLYFSCKSLVTFTRDSSGGYQFEIMGDARNGYVAAGLSDDDRMVS